ncbi:MAG: hemolysin family protein [Propionibacteriaceae bacterium]|jgi:CBS domain containing-hemolysin-like protein|nr:hemolysin family protein [Propionibacteriaceae bacterium]
MSESDWWCIGGAVGLAVVAWVLLAGESALAALSRPKLRETLAQQSRPHSRLADILDDKAPYINAATLLRGACQITTIMLVATVVFPQFDELWLRYLVTGGIVLFVWFVLWGVAAQTLGRQHAVAIATALAGPFTLIERVFGLIAGPLVIIGNALTPGRGYQDGPFSTEAELRDALDLAERNEVIEHGEREMIHSVFEFGDTLAREVMVPRTDVVYLERGKTLRQGISLALRSGFSRIPVIGDDLDDVLGVIYIKDLMRRVYDNARAEDEELLESLMRPAVFTPDSKPVDELLHEMQASRNHLVIVVEEFGGTAGLITIEDIVEEIVGEITDEFDAEPLLAEQLAAGVYRVSMRTPLDEVGDLFELELTDEDVETVGGLLAKELNMAPIPGCSAVWRGLELSADAGTGRRHQVETITIRQLPESDAADD